MLVAAHHTLDQLLVLADAIPQKRFWKRVQTLLLAKQGGTATPIAHRLSCSIRAVKNWVAPDNLGGIAALRQRPRTGDRDAWTRSTPPGSSSGSTPRLGPRRESAPAAAPMSAASSHASSGSGWAARLSPTGSTAWAPGI